MTITQLQYVMAVAEYRNFTLAAEKSFVTQPTLSMQVQKLEEELDILIFDRSKKPIALTDAGKRVIDQARHIINEANRIKDIVAQEKGFIGGEFRIGIIPTVMPTILPMFLKTFITKYPRVNLEIRELPTETLIRNLQEGTIDAGIAATHWKWNLSKNGSFTMNLLWAISLKAIGWSIKRNYSEKILSSMIYCCSKMDIVSGMV